MSDFLFEGDDDANTPLEPAEREQLRLSYITTRDELNEAELANIADASRWFERRKRNILDHAFLNELHKRMYGDVWRWAGQYRTTARNIGVDAYLIASEYYQAIDNAKYWVEHATFSPDEIAIRFSHRVVEIHPYPNGNGRFSRMIGDLLVVELGQPRFTWGQVNLVSASETRKEYITALKAADAGDYEQLLSFARS